MDTADMEDMVATTEATLLTTTSDTEAMADTEDTVDTATALDTALPPSTTTGTNVPPTPTPTSTLDTVEAMTDTVMEDTLHTTVVATATEAMVDMADMAAMEDTEVATTGKPKQAKCIIIVDNRQK